MNNNIAPFDGFQEHFKPSDTLPFKLNFTAMLLLFPCLFVVCLNVILKSKQKHKSTLMLKMMKRLQHSQRRVRDNLIWSYCMSRHIHSHQSTQ